MSGTDRDAASTSSSPAAVVGMACRYPDSPDVRSFWRAVLAARAVAADGVASRKALGAGDDGLALLATVVKEALADAGLDAADLRIAMAVEAPPLLLDAVAAGAEGLPVSLPPGDGDETSTLAGFADALAALRSGEVDLVVAAAVEPDESHFLAGGSGRLSPSGRVRAFAADADGSLPGWGAGAVVLRRLGEALKAGDRIYAVLREVALAEERPDGALRKALDLAQVEPRDVSLLEGHGSGVPAEDGEEIAALCAVFGGEGWPHLALGSAMSAFGDAGHAAGMASLIKAVLALHQRLLPPTANVSRPHERLARGPVLPNTTARPWISPPGVPRRAGVTARTAGGRWSHALLEEGPDGPGWMSLTPWPAEILLLSAPDRRALAAKVRDLSASLVDLRDGDMASLALASCGRFREGEHLRLALVAAGAEDLRRKVARTLERLETAVVDAFVDREGIYLGSGKPDGKLALLFGGMAFPGLTSGATQRFGELCLHFPEVRRHMDRAEAETADEPEPAYPLRHQFFPPALLNTEAQEAIEKELALSSRTALGMFVSYVASWDLIRALDIRPHVLAGFSLGEWGALYAAGILDLEDLARFRRESEAVEERPEDSEGIWAMVGASAARVEPVLRDFAGAVSVTVDISPENVLIGGGVREVREAAARLTAEGIWVQTIDVLIKNPPHTPMLAPWLKTIREMLGGLPVRPARLPVVCGITGEPYPEDPDAIRDLLAQVPLQHVRIQDTIQRLHADGVRTFVQTGMGGRLNSVIHSTLKLEPHLALSLDAMHRGGLEQLLHFLGRLAALGVHFAPSPLFAHRRVEGVEGPPSLRAAELAAEGPRDAVAAPPPPASSPAAGQGFAEVMAALQHFLEVSEAQEEADRRMIRSFLETQEAVMRALLPLVARQGAEARNGAAVKGPFVGEVVHLVPGREMRSRLVLDLGEHPFLLDHTLLKIPRELRPPEECLPTLPMTFGIELLAEAGALLEPGLPVLGVRDVQVSRWLWLKDDTRLPLEITARASGPGRVEAEVRMEGVERPVYSGVVLLGEVPPPPEPLTVRADKPTPHTGPELYSKDRLFHGPAFQVVEVLEGMSDEGISGVLGVRDPAELFATAPAPMIFDPVILDAVGQVCGYRSQVDGLTAYPVQVEQALVFGPIPLPGTRVRTVARRRPEAGRLVIWDLDALRPNGSVWMRLEGWKTWKFMWREEVRAFFFDQRHAPIGTPWDPGLPGCLAVRLHHATLTDLDLERLVRSYLKGEEWARYRETERLDSLLGMVAAKDAVRLWLQRERGQALHPLEISLGWTPEGAPFVRTPSDPPLALSIAHTEEEALALVAPHAEGVGCDLLPLGHRLPSFAVTALDGGERQSLPQGGPQETLEWLHRAVAAKEAAAKSHGEGYAALPRYRVRSVDTADGSVAVGCPGGSDLAVRTWVREGLVLAVTARPPGGQAR